MTVTKKMALNQQQHELPVENLDFLEEKHNCKKKHGDLFPNSCRFIFAGSSGCGKSNALLTLLFHENGLCFENIYIYSKSLYQPKYQLLQHILQKINGIGYYPYSENADVIDPNDAKENSIFIFDDVIGESQNKICSFYSMCRHRSIDVAFLCQTYVAAKKHLLRDNANILVIFKQDDLNLKHIFDEHVSPDMSYETFKRICSACWNKNKFGFLTIVKDFDLNDGRYRENYDKYIRLDSEYGTV